MSKSTVSVWLAVFVIAVVLTIPHLRHPEPALAMTAQGTDKKSLVTVPLDGGMEAVVALDHVTCELTGYVLDRYTGNFFIQYRYNVAQDFPIRQGKLPGFLMVAGQADFRQFSGNERIAQGWRGWRRLGTCFNLQGSNHGGAGQ